MAETAKTKLKETPEGVVYKVTSLNFCLLSDKAVMPEKKTEGAVGFDLGSIERVVLMPQRVSKQAYQVHTGVAVEIPKGYYGTVHLRSSVGAYRKLRLANQTGIIDSDYRGEIILLIENIGRQEEVIEEGERIAQFILHKGEPVKLKEVKSLSKTKRGAKGIGSTGRK